MRIEGGVEHPEHPEQEQVEHPEQEQGGTLGNRVEQIAVILS